jgi:hypothetical protein
MRRRPGDRRAQPKAIGLAGAPIVMPAPDAYNSRYRVRWWGRHEEAAFCGDARRRGAGVPNFDQAQQHLAPAIGFLSGASPGGARPPDIDGLREYLVEGGYIERRNLTIEYRWAEGHFDRLSALAGDLITRRVALIATVTLPAAMAAKTASPTTPRYLRDRRGPGQSRSGRELQSA